MRAKRATAEGKAGRAVVEGRGGRAKKSLEMEKTATDPEVKCSKVSGNPPKVEAEIGLAGAGKTLPRQAAVQGQGKERSAVPPALPEPIASFNI
jgi:hypothetical protein